jgi:hypothetical protein
VSRRRVVQFGTGFVGHFALRAIIEHPELELAGVWVHSDAKLGLDAGEIPGFGIVRKETADAFRFELEGSVDGRPAIVLEHVTRLRPDTAPQWPQGEHGPGYYVFVDGDPRIECHISCVGPDGDHHKGGILATGTRLVNAIPAVCAARPGLISTLDLPPLTGRGLYRPG